MLRRLRATVSPVLVNFPYRSHRVTRITESAPLQLERPVEIHSDLLHVREITGSDCAALLIYSIDDPRESCRQLVTAFPVTSDFVTGMTSADAVGDEVPVRTRFNAFVEGLTGTECRGRRVIS